MEDINRFWLVSYNSTKNLDDINDSMAKTYYNFNDSSEPNVFDAVAIDQKLSDEEMIGKYCAARISEVHWVRGKIKEVVSKSETHYRVLLIDYGSLALLSPDRVQPLR